MLSPELFKILKYIQSRKDGVYFDELHPNLQCAFQPIRISFLCEQGFIERFPVGESFGLRILPKGEIELEGYIAAAKASRKASRRYWITTLIALTALARSFTPELCALWEQLKLLLMR